LWLGDIGRAEDNAKGQALRETQFGWPEVVVAAEAIPVGRVGEVAIVMDAAFDHKRFLLQSWPKTL
jgi:hypothetical protein